MHVNVMSRKPHLASSQSSDYVRDTSVAKLPLKPKVFVQANRTVPSTVNSIHTIANLSSEEKEKVARLVSRLMKLEQEHEEVLVNLQREKDAFRESTARLQSVIEEQMPVISEKLKSKEHEINELEIKNSLSSGLLALYQAKLKNSSDMLRFHEVAENDKTIKINRLESDLFSLQSLIASQKVAIESFEASRTHTAHSLQEFQVQTRATVDRLESDKRDLAARLARAEQQVRTLQDQLEQERRSRELTAAAEAVRGTVTPSVMRDNSSSRLQGAAQHPIEHHAVLHDPKGIDMKTTILSSKNGTDDARSAVLGKEQQEQPRPQPHQQQQQQSSGDMYDPLYASFDTISFTSSHHYQHSRNDEDDGIIEDSVLADSMDQAGEFRGGGGVNTSAGSLGGTDIWSNASNGPSAAAATAVGVTIDSLGHHPRMHTALDPTPMKRRSDRVVVPGQPAAVPVSASSVSSTDAHMVDTLSPPYVPTSSSKAKVGGSRSSGSDPLAGAMLNTKRRISQRPSPQDPNDDAHIGADGDGAISLYSGARNADVSVESEAPLSTPTAGGARMKKSKKQGSSSQEGALGVQKNEKKKKAKPAQSEMFPVDENSRPALVKKKNKHASSSASAKAKDANAGEPSRHHTFSASAPHPPVPIIQQNAAHFPSSFPARAVTTISTGKATISGSTTNKKVATAIGRNTAATCHSSNNMHPREKAERANRQDVKYDESLFTLLSDLDIS